MSNYVFKQQVLWGRCNIDVLHRMPGADINIHELRSISGGC